MFLIGKGITMKIPALFVVAFLIANAHSAEWYVNPLEGEFWVDELAYGNGKWVAVGGTGVRISDNLVNWEFVTDEDTFLTRFKALSFASGYFVATGSEGIIIYSTDGVSWTPSYFEGGGRYDKVVYGNGIWLAAARLDGGLIASTNLTHWFEVLPVGGTALAYGDETFIFIDLSGDVYSSTNGLTWSSTASLPDLAISETASVSYGEGLFIACSDEIHVSTDGSNWVQRSNPPDVIYGVAYGNDEYFAVGDNALIYRSTNTIDWIEDRWTNGFSQLDQVAYGDGRIVSGGSGGVVVTEKDARKGIYMDISTSDSFLQISFTSALGRSYTLERSFDLFSWNTSEGNVIGTGNAVNRTYLMDVSNSFWKVEESE